MAENATPEGDRIAKVLSRRGVASRREAERLIEAGEVKVNGKIITSPALNVTDADHITISGHPLPGLEPARLWLYYKPEGLVTSAQDEKGRDTVFDHLPQDMPRVMSVGRLDLNSEGLLLLTNDGELKRRLELPSTGWLRKYRVRIKGNPTDPELEPLRKGIEVEGERFQPMSVVLDRHQGANAWLTIGLREGKNREIRRAINSIGLIVNRLIRVSYGPFRLGDLQPGDVEEVRQKVLRDQLGSGVTDDGSEPAARKTRPSPTRRLRPGEGVKALAKAWDEATAAQEVVKATTPRRTAVTKSAPRRAEEELSRGPRGERAAPTAKRASPKIARSASDEASPRSYAPKPTSPTGRARPARDTSDAPARRTVTTKSASRNDEARTMRAGNEEPGRRSTAPKATRAAPPKTAKPAPASGGRKISGPKPGNVKPGGPRKPPPKPRG